MPKMQIDLPAGVDAVLGTRININRLFKDGERSKAALVERIVSEWVQAHEVEIDAIAENIGGK